MCSIVCREEEDEVPYSCEILLALGYGGQRRRSYWHEKELEENMEQAQQMYVHTDNSSLSSSKGNDSAANGGPALMSEKNPG